jgi:hypothetical protein
MRIASNCLTPERIAMHIIARVKEILLTPKPAWSVIEAEDADTATLYTQYNMILAAIPAVAGFIGMSLFGVSSFWSCPVSVDGLALGFQAAC